MERLAKLPSGDLLASGIFPSLHGEAPPFWADGANVIFESGGVRKAFGYLGLANLGATPTGAKATVTDTESRVFVGAGTSAYKYTSGAGLETIGGFASSGGIYQFLPWDTWCLISNGVDPVELWQGNVATPSAAITAPFTRANVLFGYQLQAFVGGTDNGGKLVEWGPVNAVTDWTVTLTGTAGNLLLRELAGDIVAAQPIGNSVGIYSASNGGIFTFVGGTSIYAFRRPIRGIGAVSPYSVVEYGGKHYGFTKEYAFVTDLVSSVFIDEPAMRKYVRDNADWDRVTEVYGWADTANSMVRWSIPMQGSGSFGVGFRVDKGTWTRFSDGVILGEIPVGAFPMIAATTGRFMRQDNTTGDNDSGAMTAYVTSKPLDLGNRNRRKRVQRIDLDMEWSGSVNLRVGYSNHPNEDPTWVVDTAAANSIFPDAYGVFAETVYVTLEIRSTAAGAQWELSGGELWGEWGGEHVT